MNIVKKQMKRKKKSAIGNASLNILKGNGD